MKFTSEKIIGETEFFAISHIFHQQVENTNDNWSWIHPKFRQHIKHCYQCLSTFWNCKLHQTKYLKHRSKSFLDWKKKEFVWQKSEVLINITILQATEESILWQFYLSSYASKPVSTVQESEMHSSERVSINMDDKNLLHNANINRIIMILRISSFNSQPIPISFRN